MCLDSMSIDSLGWAKCTRYMTNRLGLKSTVIFRLRDGVRRGEFAGTFGLGEFVEFSCPRQHPTARQVVPTLVHRTNWPTYSFIVPGYVDFVNLTLSTWLIIYSAQGQPQIHLATNDRADYAAHSH
jgi:hypothetical protein